MPNVTDYDNQDDWMAVCVPAVMDEGKDRDAAVGQCMGMWSEKGSTTKAMQDEMMMRIEEMGVSRCRSILKKFGKDGEGMSLDEMRAMLKKMAGMSEYHDQMMGMMNMGGASLKYFSTWTDTTGFKALAVKAVGDWELDVLVVPFGSKADTDSDGQWFDASTDIMHEAFSTPLVIYQHGIKQGARGMDAKPQVIGSSIPGTLSKQSDGWHIRVALNKALKVAKDIMQAAWKGLVAVSSDSISHLARLDIGGKLIQYEKNRPGRIAVWPLAGFSLWEMGNGNFKPASRAAFALPAMKAMYRDAGLPFPDVSETTDGVLSEVSTDTAKRARSKEIEQAQKHIQRIKKMLGD